MALITDAAAGTATIYTDTTTGAVTLLRSARALAGRRLRRRGVRGRHDRGPEIARNIVVHAGSGEMVFTAVQGAGCRGIEVVAQGTGPDVPTAMRDGTFPPRADWASGSPAPAA